MITEEAANVKVRMPIRKVIDRKGNVVLKEYEDRVLTEDQVEAICAMLLSNLEERRESIGR